MVYCSGKPDPYLVSIYQKLFEANGEVFGTRADAHQYELVREVLPQVTYDQVSHILKVEKKDKERQGKIAVCTPISRWRRRRHRRQSILARL